MDTFPTDISFPADDSGSQPFRTLQEFRYIWDATQQPMVLFIVSVSPVTYMVAGNSIIAQLKTTQDIKPGGGLELTSRSLGGCTEEGINIVVSSRASKDFNEVFCRKIEEGIIVFPAKKKRAKASI